MSEFTLVAIIVGGTIAGYYLINNADAQTATLFVGAGAGVGGIVVPSAKAGSLQTSSSTAVYGAVGGVVAYYAYKQWKDGRKGVNVRARICSHCD